MHRVRQEYTEGSQVEFVSIIYTARLMHHDLLLQLLELSIKVRDFWSG